MKGILFGLLAAASVSAFGQTFLDSDRFGFSAQAVVDMGHDKWVNLYCDREHRGENAQVGAETVYCLALYDLTQARLPQFSEEDQKFYSEARSYFADLAKTSFGTGIDLSGYSEGWSLPIAKTSTAINQTIWDMVKPVRLSKPQEVPITEKHLNEMADKVEGRVGQIKPDSLGEARRYRYLSLKIDLYFEGRSYDHHQLARKFILKMGEVCLFSPNEVK